MGNVQDRFIEQGLDVQPGRREPELAPRILVRVDARIDRRPRLVESDVGMCAARDGGAEMARLVKQNAGRDARV